MPAAATQEIHRPMDQVDRPGHCDLGFVRDRAKTVHGLGTPERRRALLGNGDRFAVRLGTCLPSSMERIGRILGPTGREPVLAFLSHTTVSAPVPTDRGAARW